MIFSEDNIGLELIQYQNKDSFPDKLNKLVENIYKQIDNKVYATNKDLLDKSSFVKDIKNLIQERFNISIVIDKELSVLDIAAIVPFFSDYLDEKRRLHNIGTDNFINLFKFDNAIKKINFIIKERDEMIKKLHNKKGYIDLKNARVGGYLSNLKHYLILDFFALKEHTLTSREVVAIIIHEIGHAFGGLEYHYKLEKTNTTILDILSNINNNNLDKATYVFKTHFDYKKDIPTINSKDRFDFYSIIAFTYLNEIRTQLVNGKYDETNFENIADSFSARFGLGKELVTSLNKINVRYGQVSTSTGSFYNLFFINLLLSLMLFALLGPVGIALFLYCIIYIFGKDNADLTYDLPLDRYNRIKNSITNNLKNLNLPNDVIKDLLEQYIFITNVIEKTNYFESSLNTVADYILPSNRDAKYYIKLQQDIENGLNNILFIKVAEISVSK
ncbi:MAG: hypothetical protein ACD_33C00034G0006 [uncultured bacterium]|nr:MAG: hypothetical protein ACD_33C00034G0006 [uncultured bacterium]